MRILIFGATGYIGTEFVKQFNELGRDDIYVATAPSRNVDDSCYTFFELIRVINQHMPTVIINCAAYIGKNSVAECEKNKDLTVLSNFAFPKMLGEICQNKGIILGHMSSGCVFNGYKDGGFTEDDEVQLCFKNNNCSFYTGTKVMAEETLAHVDKKYIWRIRLPFDNIPNVRNYLSKVMGFDRLLVAENSLSNRQQAVGACIACLLKEVPYGIYHVTNGGGIRGDELAVLVRDYVKSKKNFQYFSSTEELDKLSGIPRSNTVLSNDKLAKQGIFMDSTRDSVVKCLMDWQGVIS